MNDKDIKLLWGRSGNRCAICKLELSTEGDVYSLGEMAHIIARSKDGPRGSEDLLVDQRDLYSNLILLCPTHHKEIDNNVIKWTTSELHRAKNSHEEWVSKQLEKGLIAVIPIDNTTFIRSRIRSLYDLSLNEIWVVVCLSPLTITGDIIDPLYDTHPNEHGLVNENVRRRSEGYGHIFRLFRNGHCEFMANLQTSVNQMNKYAASSEGGSIDNNIIRYTALANAIKHEFLQIKSLWRRLLPFNNMTLSVALFNTNNTILYSRETDWSGPLFGSIIKSNLLLYNNIIYIEDNDNDILFNILSRFSNYYGLILENLFTDKGEYVRPRKLI